MNFLNISSLGATCHDAIKHEEKFGHKGKKRLGLKINHNKRRVKVALTLKTKDRALAKDFFRALAQKKAFEKIGTLKTLVG